LEPRLLREFGDRIERDGRPHGLQQRLHSVKLAIVATHPIQYHVPWFRALAKREGVDLTVYYGLIPNALQQGVGFGQAFEWDIPMLEGYAWQLLPNNVPSPSLQGFRNSSTPAIDARLREDRPDAVVITGWQALPLVQAFAAAVRQGIPRVVRAESNALRPRARWKKLVQRVYLRRYHAFAAIGKANRDFYGMFGVSDEQIFDAPYFVDNERFRAQWVEANRRRLVLRSEWGIAEDATCFLFAGKLEPKKRLMDLLRAADIARDSARLHVLVVGSGALEAEARDFAARSGLPVTFAGFLNQRKITNAYAAADCLVLPSDYGETWGLVVNEGMCCSLPAIVSDRVGCAVDLVTPGLTGEVFPFGEVDRLAAILVAFASDAPRLHAMGELAWQRVQHYSVERAAQGTLDAARFAIVRAGRTSRSMIGP
jgi:glycosyltransferase involved in cell wall biosynthesis